MDAASGTDLWFPDGKSFAFTILDDTDDSTVENVRPVYELLHNLGFRTTKTVWPLACPEGSALFAHGTTMADPGHRALAVDLVRRGFELTWHCATMESSDRARVEAGLAAFHEQFGFYPSVHCNHGHNAENIYWGKKRYLSAPLRQLLAGVHRLRPPRFHGEDPRSEYFWGDLCQAHFKYVRNFTFTTLNTLQTDPETPYRVKYSPYVNYWFSTSDAPDVDAFNRLVNPTSIDRLADQGGVCILSTHLGKRFCRNGRIDRGFETTMRHLAGKNGWFVPVTPILDHLVLQGRGRERSWGSLLRIELRHIAGRLRPA